MAHKATNKTIALSDKLAHRFTSEKSDFGDEEYASSVDNYDLIIDELDYVNTQIAKIHGIYPQKRATKDKKPRKQRTVKTPVQSEWISAKALTAYFPSLLQSEITAKLCEQKPMMQDKIIKYKRLMSLHIDALTEFAQRTGLTIVTQNATKKAKRAKKQRTDEDNMVYVIRPTTSRETKKTSKPPRRAQKSTTQKTKKFRTGAASLKKQQHEFIDEENMVYIIGQKTK